MCIIVRLLVLILLVSSSFPSNAQIASVPPKEKTSVNQNISLDLSACTLTEVIDYLSKMYRINIISDVYVAEPFAPHLVIKSMPREEALIVIGNLFQRRTYFVNDIVVWRFARLAEKVGENLAGRNNSAWRWKTKGAFVVHRDDPPNDTIVLTKTETKSALPANVISISAVRAPFGVFAKEFTATVGWRFNVEDNLQDRRFSAALNQVTPSAALGAMTFLLNASQSLTIRQTEPQKEDEKRFSETNPMLRAQRDLDAALAASLTQEQQAEWARKGFLSLNIGTLSPELQKLAEKFIDEWMKYVKPKGIAFDSSQYSTFSVVLRSDLQTEVHGKSTEGMPVVF